MCVSYVHPISCKCFSSSTFKCRTCYFTAIGTNRKSDFMRELNNSYTFACLQCSFTDTQLSEFIQYKRRETGHIPVKHAVSHVGKQDDGMWVLGDNIYISPDGKLVPVSVSQHVWLGHMFRGPGVADENLKCSINLPLTKPLKDLLHILKRVMKHNFIPGILTMAGIVRNSRHYCTLHVYLHMASKHCSANCRLTH